MKQYKLVPAKGDDTLKLAKSNGGLLLSMWPTGDIICLVNQRSAVPATAIEGLGVCYLFLYHSIHTFSALALSVVKASKLQKKLAMR